MEVYPCSFFLILGEKTAYDREIDCRSTMLLTHVSEVNCPSGGYGINRENTAGLQENTLGNTVFPVDELLNQTPQWTQIQVEVGRGEIEMGCKFRYFAFQFHQGLAHLLNLFLG